MKKMIKCIVISCFVFFVQGLNAQDSKTYKFGKIAASDFNIPEMKFDSGANAIIISDIGSAKFEGNNSGFFNMIFTHYIRVKIMNNNGFDIGKFEIELYHDEEESEKLYTIKGSTFNLDNGLVTETKLEEKAIFSEKHSKHIDLKKFTMPALKAGSIFELEYVVKSPFAFNLQPWSFDGEYPRIWSEFSVLIPPPLHYIMRLQGSTQFDFDTTKEVFQSYSVRESNGAASDDSYSISGNSTYRKWVKKNVPALHEEAFITSLDNYYTRVKFQLKFVQWSEQSQRHEQSSTWNTRAKTMMESEDFGLALNHDNGWMAEDLNEIVRGSSSNEDKTRRIYDFVRNNFKVVAKSGYSQFGLYVHSSLKDIYKQREGSVAEINLLLTAMLRKAEINADPMILSTRDNGIADPNYPILDEYNYVICVSRQREKIILMDASEKYNRFGLLPIRCYNGWGHLMNEETPFPFFLHR